MTAAMSQSTEDGEEEEELKIGEEITTNFRLKLEEFSFESPQTSPVRRSARSSAQRSDTPKRDPRSSKPTTGTSPTVTRKRSIASTVEDDSPTKAKKKRGYAPPETYAHLNYLADCLGEYLDVLFCGINPGVHSATVGHHFAHPGNRFYKMLYGSGFTDRLIPPEEDNTLPALYNIGITDIVDRPSSCEDELSAKEMIDGVPSLLQKVAKYKPRFVCFIGKGMGQRVEKGIRKQKNRTSPTKGKGGRTDPDVDNGIGLRPYKVTHNESDSPVCETLFFVSHSSSGLATSMNLQGKIDLLKELRAFVEEHKKGTLDTSSLEEVPGMKETAQ